MCRLLCERKGKQSKARRAMSLKREGLYGSRTWLNGCFVQFAWNPRAVVVGFVCCRMHQQQELNLSIASSVGLKIYLYSLQNQLHCSFVLNCCFMMMMDHVDPSHGGFCWCCWGGWERQTPSELDAIYFTQFCAVFCGWLLPLHFWFQICFVS